MTSRTLHLRPAGYSVGSGGVAWDQPEAVLLQDDQTAKIALANGTDAPALNVRFSHTGEAIYPVWQVAGLEVQVRAAVIGQTAIGLSQPVLGVRVRPVDHALYDSGQREVPVPYAAQASTSVILGGPGDLWGVASPLLVAQDAVTTGVLVELDPLPWVARAASLEVDSVELYLHLVSSPLGVSPLGAGLSRIQHQRLGLPGTAPTSLSPGELAVNYADRQVWSGAEDGTPVPLISFRGRFSTTVLYSRFDVVVFNGAFYEANRVILPGGVAFDVEAWTAL